MATRGPPSSRALSCAYSGSGLNVLIFTSFICVCLHPQSPVDPIYREEN